MKLFSCFFFNFFLFFCQKGQEDRIPYSRNRAKLIRHYKKQFVRSFFIILKIYMIRMMNYQLDDEFTPKGIKRWTSANSG